VRDGRIVEAANLGFDFEAPPIAGPWIDSGKALEAADRAAADYCRKNGGRLANMLLMRGAFNERRPDGTTWTVGLRLGHRTLAARGDRCREQRSAAHTEGLGVMRNLFPGSTAMAVVVTLAAALAGPIAAAAADDEAGGVSHRVEVKRQKVDEPDQPSLVFLKENRVFLRAELDRLRQLVKVTRKRFRRPAGRAAAAPARDGR
jgi:hypothetical protein